MIQSPIVRSQFLTAVRFDITVYYIDTNIYEQAFFSISRVEYSAQNSTEIRHYSDRLCGLVVRVIDYRCRGPGFDSQALQKKVVGLERGLLSLVSITEELLDRKVAAPV
jgi:hypothetical protein